MTTEEQVATFIRDMERSGVDMNHAAMANGVWFTSEETARIFAERHAKEVVPIDGGWLAKTRSAVEVLFANRAVRHFATHTAFVCGAILVVPINDTEMKFHFQEVVRMTITDDHGAVIETIQGPATPLV